jgi:hypothetical protein
MVISRLAVLSLGIALAVGTTWSWRTSPWYLLPDQYYFTIKPEDSTLQRGGSRFDINFPYHRTLLVSGPNPKPFGADPYTNIRLAERGFDFGSSVAKFDARLYSQNCGFIDDKAQPDRIAWKQAILCNSGELHGELLQAALNAFHEKVDQEITDYRLSLVRNAADKLGKTILAAFSLVVLIAAGMWVAKGHII